MELQLHPHYWTRSVPDWKAAAVAGLAAGAVLMVLDLCWPLALDGSSPWATPHKVAAIVMGQQALQSSAFDLGIVATALLIHYTLGIFSGLVIGIVIAGFHYETSLAMVQAIGAMFGVGIYLVNFYFLTALFPWFATLRGWSGLLGHLLFGVSAAMIYWKLSRTPKNT
jgi:hypothetical protein